MWDAQKAAYCSLERETCGMTPARSFERVHEARHWYNANGRQTDRPEVKSGFETKRSPGIRWECNTWGDRYETAG